jgi:hypothetical protein
LIRALRMKVAARRAKDLALSPMTGKGPKRYGIRHPERAMTASRIGRVAAPTSAPGLRLRRASRRVHARAAARASKRLISFAVDPLVKALEANKRCCPRSQIRTRPPTEAAYPGSVLPHAHARRNGFAVRRYLGSGRCPRAGHVEKRLSLGLGLCRPSPADTLFGIGQILFVGGHSGTRGTEPLLTYFGLPLTVCRVTDSSRSLKSGHCQIQIRPLALKAIEEFGVPENQRGRLIAQRRD